MGAGETGLPVLASRTDCLELQGDGNVTSLGLHSRLFGILVMSEWPSSHCGLELVHLFGILTSWGGGGEIRNCWFLGN